MAKKGWTGLSEEEVRTHVVEVRARDVRSKTVPVDGAKAVFRAQFARFFSRGRRTKRICAASGWGKRIHDCGRRSTSRGGNGYIHDCGTTFGQWWSDVIKAMLEVNSDSFSWAWCCIFGPSHLGQKG